LLTFGLHPACSVGMYCDAGTCAVSHTAGTGCKADLECAGGLQCHLQTCGTDGPVDATRQCLADSDCKTGLYCPDIACAARKSAGASCTFVLMRTSECLGYCGPMSTCVSFCSSG